MSAVSAAAKAKQAAYFAAYRASHKAEASVYGAQWYEANKVRKNAQSRANYLRRREIVLAKSKVHYAANKALYAALGARWIAENPEARRAHWNARRARKLSCDGSHTGEQVAALLVNQGHKCVGCFNSIAAGHEVDHIMPLVLGGSNDIANIQLLCMPCNRRKGSTDPVVWAQRNGRLL